MVVLWNCGAFVQQRFGNSEINSVNENKVTQNQTFGLQLESDYSFHMFPGSLITKKNNEECLFAQVFYLSLKTWSSIFSSNKDYEQINSRPNISIQLGETLLNYIYIQYMKLLSEKKHRTIRIWRWKKIISFFAVCTLSTDKQHNIIVHTVLFFDCNDENRV